MDPSGHGAGPDRDPLTRFTDRVDNYARFRPDYPESLVPLLERELGLTPRDTVADIGSGTGLLAVRFLEHGNPVVGVEPNDPMREAGDRLLGRYPRFRSIAGRAENTGLRARSVDVVAAGQAFHWFDTRRARTEWRRVLRGAGRVTLIWNNRDTRRSPFLSGYEALLLRHGTDYPKVDHQRLADSAITGFFAPAGCRRLTLPHAQVLDFAGLCGRLLSSSYVPGEGESGCEPMLDDLRSLFDAHQKGGRVVFPYKTGVWVGELA